MAPCWPVLSATAPPKRNELVPESCTGWAGSIYCTFAGSAQPHWMSSSGASHDWKEVRSSVDHLGLRRAVLRAPEL